MKGPSKLENSVPWLLLGRESTNTIKPSFIASGGTEKYSDWCVMTF